MTRRALASTLFLLVAGCGPSLPEPVIRSVEPAAFEEGKMPLLRVAIEAVLPFSVDYASGQAAVVRDVSVRIGDAPLSSPGPFADGMVTGVAPFGLAPGVYEVSVDFPDGRRASLPGGLRVVPGQFPQRFVIEPIAEQTRGVPFDLTIRADGGSAGAFEGVVRLKVSKGTISPDVTGAFVDGVRTERVIITAPGPDIVITVEDSAGHTGSSAPFRVRP